MAQVIEVQRKSSVLKRPSLPCLSAHYTINLMAGCPYECRYCYAQSFQSHPGLGVVRFYANTYEKLRGELPRKRRKPELAYFSTACEPFVPHDAILGQLCQAMELLLEHRIFLLISTKSRVPERFLDLFIRHPGLVHVQIGLTTVNDQVRQLLEPNAASVEDRLGTLRGLIERDIRTEVRIDPLVPELTDTETSFTALCDRASRCGARRAVTSYLFLRQANYRRLNVIFDGWSLHEMAARLYTHQIEEYCGSGSISVPAAGYRREKYRRLAEIAARSGLQLGLCRCKNPDLTNECCHPQPPKTPGSGRQQLFLGH